MKKNLLSLLALLMISAMSAFAAEWTYTPEKGCVTANKMPQTQTFNEAVWDLAGTSLSGSYYVSFAGGTNPNITFGSAANPFSEFSMSTDYFKGKKIVSISVALIQNQYAKFTGNVSFGSTTVDFGTIGTTVSTHTVDVNAVGETLKFTFTNSNSATGSKKNGNCCVGTITVVYEEVAAGPQDFTFEGFKDYTLEEDEMTELTLPEDAPAVSYTSSDANVAEVDGSHIYAYSAGSATITASWEAVADKWNAGSAEFTVTVTEKYVPELGEIVSDPEAVEGVITLFEGETITFSAKDATSIEFISDATNGAEATGNTITYTAPAGVESDHIIVSAHLGDASTELEVTVAIKERPMTYELTFGGNTIQEGSQVYTKTWTAQIEKQIWNISNFNNNNNGWDHIRAGRKGYASVAKIATAFAYPAQITDVVVTITECTEANVNSFTLTTYTDEALNNVVETVNATATAGDVAFTLTAPANNLYYVITLDLKEGTGNGFVRISKVAYLTEHPAVPVPATMYVHYFTEGAWNVSAMDENNTVSVDLNTNDEYFFSTFDGQTPEVVAYAEIENKDAFADHDVYANNYSGKGIGEGFAPYTAEEDGTHKLTLSIAEDGTHTVDKTVTTGVENVIANEAEVEYFNLQGVRVANPENGIFIRRQGNTVSKVSIR